MEVYVDFLKRFLYFAVLFYIFCRLSYVEFFIIGLFFKVVKILYAIDFIQIKMNMLKMEPVDIGLQIFIVVLMFKINSFARNNYAYNKCKRLSKIDKAIERRMALEEGIKTRIKTFFHSE